MREDARGPVRQCVSCRERGAREDLIRVVVAPDGSLVVDLRARLPGRGAWVHSSAACLLRLEEKPGILQRALKETVSTSGLLAAVRSAVLRALADGLSLAAAGGALVGGHDALVAALRAGTVDSVLTASDAAERTLRSVRGEAGDVPFVTLPLDRDALGGQVGSAPRAAVGVLANSASTHLRRQLRRLEALG